MRHTDDIAIVGMSVHVPGAAHLSAYWQNLSRGVSSIRRLDKDALLAAGEPADRIARANYVPAAAVLDGFDEFDAEFFGFSPKEAAILDPQHRQFLEVSWEALENAGHPPETFPGKVGVYAGCGMGSYFYFNICSNPDLVDDVGMFLLRHTGNDKDFLSTRVSHVLDLKGPSLNIQTACSTSLVAVHYARQALLNGDCDMALAGGATVELPHGRGYLFQENEILSPDGECHAFDHRAEGTVFGSGAGAVVLRRLSDALADGDHIWAVLKGSAVNNDGADKAGYLAPSVSGQAQAIAAAHTDAGITADTIGYVECHGTGTYLGDPIEVSALTDAFGETTDKTGFCKIGSVKTNIGHLDTAAGVASLTKTALALHNKAIPPSLGYDAPNPVIDFDNSPFSVADRLTDWAADGPRRAGVNSLGVGGTNAHLVMEEAPARAASEESDWPFHILCVSGHSKAALDGNTAALAEHLRANPDQPLADIAFTLKEGRKAFEHRRVVVGETHGHAADLLDSGDRNRVFTHRAIGKNPEVVFMFPGGGAQYAGMARDLYETEPVFRDWMDRGLDRLQPQLDYDIRALWLPAAGTEQAAETALQKPSVQLPLIMITEYALAQLWISWGVTPAALVGHSMGENTAACLAGVIGFEDCIDLVLLRGQLFDRVPRGGMLSVPLALDALRVYMSDDLDIASVNAPDLTAVSGPQSALDALEANLAADGIAAQRIPIDIAAHSRMLDPILDDFRAFLADLDLKAPKLRMLSNSTGDWITETQATDPDYWVGHLRHSVLFADCVETLTSVKERVYLEVGPGKALSSLAQMNASIQSNQVHSSLRHPDQDIADDLYFLGLLGRLWAVGVAIDWDQIWGDARRVRLPLPSYAFQRKRYFIEPGVGATQETGPDLTRRDDIAEWGYVPVWRPQYAVPDPALEAGKPHNWLIFMDNAGLGERIAAHLRDGGHAVTEVQTGDMFARTDAGYSLSPEGGADGYGQLIDALAADGQLPDRIAHLWGVTDGTDIRPGATSFDRNQECGFYSLTFLAQALGNVSLDRPLHICAVTNGAAQVSKESLPFPEKAMIAGPAGVMPRELPGVTCATFDVELAQEPARKGRRGKPSPANAATLDTLANSVVEELFAQSANTVAAQRGSRRSVLDYRPAELPEAMLSLKEGGTYLITGGIGGIAVALAEDLATKHQANLVLVSRTRLPDRADWETVLRRTAPQNKIARNIKAVQNLERLGATVMVAPADICDLAEMTQVVERAREKFGAINGVFHAAGHIDDAPMLAKSQSTMAAVLAPKVQGLRILDALFPDGTLDHLVLFSSTSTVIRPAGQVDYVAANEYLNAYAKSRVSDETRVTAVNWGVWAEVGMAAALVGGGTQGDIAPIAVDQPLLDNASHDASGARVFTTTFSPNTHWLLDEHRTAEGAALIPGTGYIELARQALRAHGETVPFELTDLMFLHPLGVADGESAHVQIRLIPSDQGYAFEVQTATQVDGQDGHRVHVKANIRMLAETSHVEHPLDLVAIAARTKARDAAGPSGSLQSPQETHLDFGPRWRVLQSRRFGAGEGLAELALPEAAMGDIEEGFGLHPALLDLATGWAMELIPGYQGAHLWVPLGYGRITVTDDLPERVVSSVTLSERGAQGDGFASFDVVISDPLGNVCVRIEEFSVRRLDAQAGFGTGDTQARAGFTALDDGFATELTQAEERLAFAVSQGIRPREGRDALMRAMALGAPQVIVSPVEISALRDQADATVAPEPASGQKFDRPDVDTDFVAPEGAIEETLAGFWQELLGLSEVGAQDSFFDLGGHSLIAVRLFAMIKKTYQVDFPISVLFEAPTIATCAALIAQRTGLDAAAATPSSNSDAAPTQIKPTQYTHLVPIHGGQHATGRPFFLVSGMFGNVLNLRHLGHQLGQDRPVYGLQARGLLGDQDPHRNVADAARDMIAEIRDVCPEGPYLLGGFSGGGITAYEMARQLHAQDQDIGAVVMLDTPLPVRPSLTRQDKILIKLAELRSKGPAYIVEWAQARRDWQREQAAYHADADAPQQFHDHAIEAAFRDAVASYDLQPWHGPLTLYRPALDRHWKVSGDQWVSRAKEYVLEDNDWTRWALNLDVIEVPGDHDSMVLEPHVRVLVRHLRAQLTKADALATPNARVWAPATAAE